MSLGGCGSTRNRVLQSVLQADIGAVQPNLTRPIGCGGRVESDEAPAPVGPMSVRSIPGRSTKNPASSLVSRIEPLVLLLLLVANVLGVSRRLSDAEEGPVHLCAGCAPTAGKNLDRKLAPTHEEQFLAAVVVSAAEGFAVTAIAPMILGGAPRRSSD
ncbi:hypothetical protein B0H16DRAFT_1522009 [Mycena metata]|uniref:Uncharacterized protein n=1 Tax=Mycena metata TaxID=1033252 RepID=A0AAD7JK78_9AGAR|nr:hypothetical protein B0H16DRAFT_1522009 [Mycena metata]